MTVTDAAAALGGQAATAVGTATAAVGIQVQLRREPFDAGSHGDRACYANGTLA